MNHPDSDAILKYALETLGPDEFRDIETHVTSCGECRRTLDSIRADITLISGLDAEAAGAAPLTPFRPRAPFLPALRFAAVLVAGFLAGYLLSEQGRTGPVTVVPQRFEPSPAPVAADRFTSCDVIDVASEW